MLMQIRDTAVIEKEISVSDERQKVSITVEKQDAETGNTVAGAVFGIYNAKLYSDERWKSDRQSRYSFTGNDF